MREDQRGFCTWGRWGHLGSSFSSICRHILYEIRVDRARPLCFLKVTNNILHTGDHCGANNGFRPRIFYVCTAPPRVLVPHTDSLIYYVCNIYRRLARRRSASSVLMASRYLSRMFSSTCFLKTTIGSSSCSIRHVGHSMDSSYQVVMQCGWNTCLHLSFLSLCFVSSRQIAQVEVRCALHFPS